MAKDDSKSQIETLEAKILEIRIQQLEDSDKKFEKTLEKLADIQHTMAEKIVQLDTNSAYFGKQLNELLLANRTQNKLLMTIATTAVGTLMTLLVKAIFHI